MRRTLWLAPVLALVASTTASAGDVVSTTETEPYPGLRVVERIEENPSNRIYVTYASLCHDGVHVVATAPPSQRRTPGAWGNDRGVQVAVNGDFFAGASPPQVYGDAVGEGSAWPLSQTGLGQPSAWYHERHGWIAFGPDWVDFSHTERTKTADAERFGVSLGYQPTTVTTDKPSGTLALVSGFPELVIEGQTYTCSDPTASDCFPDRSDMRQRHPRTAMGLTEDRKTFILAVVDGRDAPSSVGMYGSELAALMADLGAWQAFNLDGGGSTAMWLEGEGYVNQPSDGSARTVANHWGVFAGSGHGQPVAPTSCFVPGGCYATPLAGAESEPFVDMPAGSFAYDEAILLRDEGITNGCSSDPPMFCPSCPLKRAQVVTFLVKAAGWELSPPTEPTFDDVQTDDWFFPFVEAAVARGVTMGCDENSFCPHDPVTRAQLAAFVTRAADWTVGEHEAGYTDVPADHPFFGPIEEATARCVFDGCEDGRFCPDEAATRAQAAVVIVRAFGLDPDFACVEPGAGGAGGTAGTGGVSSPGGSGAAAAGPSPSSQSGCDCRQGGSQPPSAMAFALLGLMVLARRRGR